MPSSPSSRPSPTYRSREGSPVRTDSRTAAMDSSSTTAPTSRTRSSRSTDIAHLLDAWLTVISSADIVADPQSSCRRDHGLDACLGPLTADPTLQPMHAARGDGEVDAPVVLLARHGVDELA